MNYQLELFKQNRRNILSLLEAHNLQQVNTILPGTRNNILWNAGHLLVSQQFLWYHFSGLPLNVPEELIGKYAGDTIPSGQASQAEFEEIKSLLRNTAEKALSDYEESIFQNYQSYTSEYFGLTMNTIDEAIQFNNYHEGVHFGHMARMRRALIVSSIEN